MVDKPYQYNRPSDTLLERLIRLCLEQKFVVLLLVGLIVCWGILTAPFDWSIGGPLRNPVPVDAIPDIGENQQIVFTEWAGRSPQDIEDQVTYPLTVALMGVPGVKTVRSSSEFGFSSIFLIFEDEVDFYWARSRILEKLNSLPPDSLPPGVRPVLGPDATAMGQVFWYTLEGRDEDGRVTGGWDLHELRTIQDWYVRYALLSVEGVSEVGSVGGFVQEYQVDLDPDLMRVNGVNINEVVAAVQEANLDVGARTIEVNKVEYLVRGVGFIQGLEDLENAVIKLKGGVPVLVGTVAKVTLGPALRRGALDKGGVEAVGGVVVVRYGENPLRVIARVKQKIEEIAAGMPRKTLEDGRVSQVRVIPFYDRTQLIEETLATLESALTNEVLITVIVIIALVFSLNGSLLIAALLPVAVLMCFVAMKIFKVDANIVALSGIAIAIGAMVDMGIIITENVIRHLGEGEEDASRRQIIFNAAREVGGAVLVAASTTIVSFLPVFALVSAEGKLFKPLAYTKTFALTASLIIALCVMPVALYYLLGSRPGRTKPARLVLEGLIYLGGVLVFIWDWRFGLPLALIGAAYLFLPKLTPVIRRLTERLLQAAVALALAWLLSSLWRPLGLERSLALNFIFVVLLIGGLLAGFKLFQHYYLRIIGWCLNHKKLFLSLPLILVVFSVLIWQGYDRLLGWAPGVYQNTWPARFLAKTFPGLEKEFMPPLDEGAFLLMPSTMPHASIGEVLEVLQQQDISLEAVPEVDRVVGKLGRVESPLDPAPVSMIETLITYKTEYLLGPDGKPGRYRFDSRAVDLARDADGRILNAPDGRPYFIQGRFARDDQMQLAPDSGGRPFRLWRPELDPELNPGRAPWPGVWNPDDIWDLIVEASQMPGTTVPARLQPISARMVMLQSGIRARLGVRVIGPDLASIEIASRRLEEHLRQVTSIKPETVIADRIVSKPYLEIHLKKAVIAQFGIRLQEVLNVIEFAIGGKPVTTTVEGRERYPVRVRYIRELRDDIESLAQILVPAPDGSQVPLMQLADILYVRGPGVIKGEDTFLVGYVLFDPKADVAEVKAVEDAQTYLGDMMDLGRMTMPDGVSYSFIGTYENQVRSEKRLMAIIPAAIIIIFVILYVHFKSIATSTLVLSQIVVAWAGGFLMIWLWGQPWFLDFSLFGQSVRELFHLRQINLSVAVWVGFLALFGIAIDDGVVMATNLTSAFRDRKPDSVEAVRQITMEAAIKRVRPCLMTTATTLIALLPVLTSTGRGSDIMIPMAIPTFGGMTVVLIDILVVPVLYCAVKEGSLKRRA